MKMAGKGWKSEEAGHLFSASMAVVRLVHGSKNASPNFCQMNNLKVFPSRGAAEP